MRYIILAVLALAIGYYYGKEGSIASYTKKEDDYEVHLNLSISMLETFEALGNPKFFLYEEVKSLGKTIHEKYYHFIEDEKVLEKFYNLAEFYDG